jgi:hypothetical protein
MTWSVWMKMPLENGGGFSRVAGDLSKEDAERFAAAMLFPARAMPDEES